MPTHETVDSPINVMGIGRSGTTLLCSAVSLARAYQNCGETSDAIFAAYAGFSRGFTDQRIGGQIPHSELAVAAVRAALVAVMPTETAGWVQKVAGIPKLIEWKHLIDDDDRRYGGSRLFPYNWYWRVLAETFPNSVNILCIRNPYDVSASRLSMSGWSARGTWNDYCLMAKIFLHPKAKVHAVFDLDRYHTAPQQMVDELSAALGIDLALGFQLARRYIFARDPNHTYEDFAFRRAEQVDPAQDSSEMVRMLLVGRLAKWASRVNADAQTLSSEAPE
jgi:hypothetical protein